MARKPGTKRPPFTRQDTGPFCDARRSFRQTGGVVKRCKQPAGWRTDHPGVGRCKFHGGITSKQTKHGRYSTIKHKHVSGILDELEQVHDQVMDLAPETKLIRALLIDYVNRYDEFQEALMAWYADKESNTKPRRIMDISDAANLVESVSRVVHRMHQIESEGAISLVTFKRVTEQMGIIVAKHVKDERTLSHISEEWGLLALDAKTSPIEEVEAQFEQDEE